MKVDLTTREIRLVVSALQNEAVRLVHREEEAGLNKEYEALWNKFVYFEAKAKQETSEKHDSETHG
jgi:hypothetical protein